LIGVGASRAVILIPTAPILILIIHGISRTGIAEIPQTIGVLIQLPWVENLRAVVYADSIPIFVIISLAGAGIAEIPQTIQIQIFLVWVEDLRTVVQVSTTLIPV